MASYDLPAMARRARPNSRQRSITLREIAPPAVLATDLYRQCYLPVINAWTRALPAIEAAYAASLSELTTDAAGDVTAEIDGAAEEVSRLLLLLTPAVKDWALRVEKWYRGKWRGAVLSATGVDLETMLGPDDVRKTLEATIEWNTSLIKDVSDQARKRIGDAVFSGLNQRQPAREVAKAIRGAVTMGRDRSVRIASDQLSKLSSSLAEERQREAGIEQVIWRHSRKKHPRADHVKRDGKRFYLDSKKAVDGSETVEAGDWAGQRPYCGCRTQAWIDLMDDED